MQVKRRAFGANTEVSLFTLGTMRAISSVEKMYLALKEACLIGINHIETSPCYGPAEVLLAEALKKLEQEKISPIDKWVVTSKILPGISYIEGKRQIKQIISDIGISKIDNLAIHGLNRFDHLKWTLEGEGAKILNWALNKNLIGQIGFSSHGTQPLIKKAISSRRFKFCSLHLHLLNQTNLPLARLALQQGMGVMAISPADKGGHLHSPSQRLIEDCWPIEPLELAYRFLLAQGISTLTLGATKSSDFSLAKKLINSTDQLSRSEQDCIENLFHKASQRLNNTLCGQCRKCLPCPNNVPIPEILNLRNLHLGHDLQSYTRERYNLIGRASHWWEEKDASACEKCRECIPLCPYNLNIPELLEETHLLLSDKPSRRLWE